MQRRCPDRVVAAVDVGAISADISADTVLQLHLRHSRLLHSLAGVVPVNPEKDRFVEVMRSHSVNS